MGKHYGPYFDVLFVVYCWGTVVIYEKIILSFLPTILWNFGMDKDYANSQ